jgi:integrase
MTFNDIYPRWISWKKKQVKQSSLAAYQLQWSTRIQAYWGDKEVEDMRSRHFQDWVEMLIDEGKLSLKSIQDAVTIVKSMLSWAWTYYELPSFTIKIVYPTESCSTEGPTVKSFSHKDQERLVKYLIDNPSYSNMGILLTLMTGLRIGEVAALKFEDLDFEKHCINISRTLSRVYMIDEVTGKRLGTKMIEGNPKSRSSRRSVPLYGPVEKWLKNASKIVKPEYYVTTGKASPCEPRTYRNHFKKVLKELGLENIKFHGLRHTFATRLITSNVDFKTVSEILGHSDISMTLNIYSHPDETQKRNGAMKAFKQLCL